MKTRFFILFLGIIFILSACAEKKQTSIEVPKVLIQEDKMAEIIGEVQLIEAYIEQIPFNKRGNSDTDYVYFPLLFKKYHISKEIFFENLAYYSQNEEIISSIYDKSIIILNKIKAKDLELRLEMKLDSIRQDSIRALKDKLSIDSLNDAKLKQRQK